MKKSSKIQATSNFIENDIIMKRNLLLCLAMLVLSIRNGNSQTVACRQKMSMVCYEYHNDLLTVNPVRDRILSVVPDILIDNTPHGFWGEQNGYIGCNPSLYTIHGTKVFSYITGGYEGTKYQNDTSGLFENLNRVNGIYSDGATGVFLDEVSHHPTTAGKIYIDSIFNRCRSLGMKLIVNPGTTSFDSWLSSHCDYLVSDEHYNGRSPSSSELSMLDSIIVLSQLISNVSTADSISNLASTNRFGYYYPCYQYINIPTWIEDYSTNITHPPLPNFNYISSGLSVSFTYTGAVNSLDSVTWLFGGSSMYSGLTTTHTYPSPGTYEVCAISHSSCGNDTICKSLAVIATSSVSNTNLESELNISPNPANGYVNIKLGTLYSTKQTEYKLLSIDGKVVLSGSMNSNESKIGLGNIPSGVYIFSIQNETINSRKLLNIEN